MVFSGLSTAIVVAAALTACGKRRPPAADTGETALMRKADGYLQCHGEYTHVVFRLADRYRERLVSAPLPVGAEVVLPQLTDPKPCLDAIAAAKDMAPSLPELEAAGAAYGVALATIHRLTTPRDRSRTERTNADLIGALDAFDRAQVAMFDQVYAINRTVHITQFEKRLRKEGRTVAVMVDEAELNAEDLVRFAAIPADQLDKLDVAALTRSLASFERTLEDLVAFKVQLPDDAQQFLNFDNIVRQAGELALTARQLMRRVQGNIVYSETEKLMIAAGNGANVVGTPAALAVAYNRLIEIR